MITAKYTRKISLQYLGSDNIESHLILIKHELIDLNYTIVRNTNHSIQFTNREIINSHWIKRNLTNGIITLKRDRENLIVEFRSKVIIATVFAALFTLIAIWHQVFTLLIFAAISIGIGHLTRKRSMESFVRKTFSREETSYSKQNPASKVYVYLLYALIALILILTSIFSN